MEWQNKASPARYFHVFQDERYGVEARVAEHRNVLGDVSQRQIEEPTESLEQWETEPLRAFATEEVRQPPAPKLGVPTKGAGRIPAKGSQKGKQKGEQVEAEEEGRVVSRRMRKRLASIAEKGTTVE